MKNQNTTACKNQKGNNSESKSIIKTIGNWLKNNSDSILKLTGSIAIVIGTLLVANYESKMSAITLINQREQAESELRSNMFSHLISPVAGPYQDSAEVDSHRECLLVKLLALNFHEHFEFKPLMLHVDARLAKKHKNKNFEDEQGKSEEEKEMERIQAGCDRDSLRSIARRVANRQIALLIKEGASEPVSLEIKVPGEGKEIDLRLDEKDFIDPEWINILFKKGIIEKDSSDPNYLIFSDFDNDQNSVGFINYEKKLIERLKDAGFKEEDIRMIKEIWREKQNSFTPKRDEKFIKARHLQYVEMIPPESDGKNSVEVMLSDVDWENETVDIVFLTKNGTDNNNDINPQKFNLTWYDFPLTDNTILQDGNRFSFVFSDIYGDVSSGGTVTLKVIWYPKDYFTARERPIKYQEFREKLGI
ncbi:MAG: hypothetical protein ACMUIU_12815 [bacterium]